MADVGAPTYPRGVADDDTSAPLTASAFHAEPGTEGWHVLYGGAQTIFPTGSFAVGAALVARIIEVTARSAASPTSICAPTSSPSSPRPTAAAA